MLVRREPSDGQVVRSVLAGDRQAFSVLVARHLAMVHAVAYSHSVRPADVDDIVQETFIKAFTSLATLRRAEAFRSWLATIARNMAFQFARREHRSETPTDPLPEPGTPPVDFARRDLHDAVRRQVDSLPPEAREALLLRYFAGLKVRDLAEVLTISPGAAAKRLERARALLGERLLDALEPALREECPTAAKAGRLTAAVLAAVPARPGAATSPMGVHAVWATLKAPIIVTLAVLATMTGVWFLRGLEKDPAENSGGAALVSPQAPVVETADAAISVGAAVLPLLAVQPSLDGAAPTVDGGAALAGRVYDAATGRGIEGVAMSASRHGGGDPVASCETDGDGLFRLAGLDEGLYTVERGDVPGYGNPRWRDRRHVSLKAGQEFNGIEFALSAGLSIAGRVIDGDGAPVEDAEVVARGRDLYSPPAARTGPDGAFSLQGLAPMRDLYVRAAKTGLAGRPAGPLDVSERRQPTVTLTLEPEARAEGRVVDRRGRPVPGAGVRAVPQDPSGFAGPTGRTDEEGGFHLAGLAEGVCAFETTAPNASPYAEGEEGPRAPLRSGETVRGLVLVFEPGSLTLSGRVTDEDGIPVEGASVRVMGPTDWSARSGADGRYTIAGLTEGAHTVVAQTGFDRLGRLYTEAGRDDADLVLRERGVVRGQVLRADTGEPVQRFSICVMPGISGGRVPPENRDYIHVEDDEGRFTLPGPLDNLGWATVAARAPGYAPAFLETGCSPEGLENLVLRLHPERRVSGTVFGGGRPLEGALLFTGPMAELHPLDLRTSAEAVAGADGRFDLAGVSPKAAQVIAWHPDFAPGSAPIAGDAPVTVRLPRPAAVEGTVRIDGEALPHEQVELTYTDAPLVWVWRAHTDEDGRYRIDGLHPGAARVWLHRSLHDTVPGASWRPETPVTIAEGATATVDLRLGTGTASVRGLARLPAGAVRGGDLYAWVSGDTPGSRLQFGIEAGGTFAAEGLPAGLVTLRASVEPDAGPRRTADIVVELAEGEQQTQDIVFDRGATLSGTVTGAAPGETVSVGLLHGQVSLGFLNQEEPTHDWLADLMNLLVWETELPGNGPFAIEGLDPGTYTCIARTAVSRNQIARSALVTLEVEEAGQAGVILSLRP